MKKYQKYLIAFLISVFAATYLMGQKTTIHFKKDSYHLSEKAKLRLDSLSDVLLKTNDLSMEIRLTGFTDADANEKYNQELSRQRAVAVYEYLSTKGLMHQFEIIVRGENDPLNLNTDEHEKSINRRVEIDFQKKQKNYAYDVFKEKKQVFLINPEKDTVITCEKGTKIEMGKLMFKNTDLFKPITVEVQEYSTMNDYVLNNLSTAMPNGTFLESRGMINLEIKQDEKPLEPKPGKTVDILFKDRKLDDKTDLFYGEENGGHAIWHQSSDTLSSSTSIYGYSYFNGKNGIVYSLEDAKRNKTLISEWIMDTINGEPCRLISYYNEKMKVYKKDTVFVENEELIEALMIKTAKFGLINCDRFTRDPNPRMELMVETDGTENANIILAFDDIKAMLPYSYREGNKYYFSKIPENLNARVIGINKLTKESDISFASEKIKTESNKPVQLKFEMKSKEEIEKIMKEI